jgi:hypothetical protein
VEAERARETIAAAPPRRLRLDELLRELGAHAEHASDGMLAAGSGTHDPKSPSEVAVTEPDAPGPRPDVLTVGELVDKAAEAGFGFLIGILALIAIPFFGLSTPFGLAIALIGAQMLLGRTRPWLPQRARRRPLKMSMLDRVLGILARRTRWLARSTRRRWEGLISTRAIGFGILILALGLALPLPIPGSNMIFLVPIFVYAIGLLERDGAWVALAHAWLVVNVGLLVAFSTTVIVVLEQIWRWIT